jgi:PAS domain S-box-containing protein
MTDDTGRAAPFPPVYCILHEGIVTFVSSACDRVSGHSFAHFHGRQALELVHPDDQRNVEPYFADGWEGVFRASFRLQDVDGAWTWRQADGVRTIDDNGHPSAICTLRKVDAPLAASF